MTHSKPTNSNDLQFKKHGCRALPFSHTPISIPKMTKNQARVMACMAARAMGTIPTLASVINKIGASNGGIISTQLACLLAHSDTMQGNRSPQDASSLQLFC